MNLEMDILPRLERVRGLAPAGFAIGLHIRFTTPAYLLQTYPAAWIDEYSRDGLVLHDPTVAWGLAHTGTIGWFELSQGDSPVMERAARHGLVHGLTVSLLRGGSRSMAGFARSDRGFRPDEVAAIEQDVTGLHDATAADLDSAALRRISATMTAG